MDANDTDYFSFVSPRTGTVSIVITNRSTTLIPALSTFYPDMRSSGFGPDVRTPGSNLRHTMEVQENQIYFLQVWSQANTSRRLYRLIDRRIDCTSAVQCGMVWLSGISSQNWITTPKSPLYRQLSEQIAQQIRSGVLPRGERLPATRELAGLLGLNRTTVSAAYEMLEAEGLIAGQVGRGSFVTGERRSVGRRGGLERRCWSGATPPRPGPIGGWSKDVISFAVSRPSRDLFPLDEFRASCATVLARRDLADILQLGSPSGYEPLAALPDGGGAAAAGGGSGRRPADHQRLPAGAGPDWARAAAARRHGGGGRSDLHRA